MDPSTDHNTTTPDGFETPFSTITIRYHYPEVTDPLELEEMTRAMHYVGLFSGVKGGQANGLDHHPENE